MSTSRVGLWDSKYAGNPERQMYADPLSAELAGEWLRRDDIVTVEDWGCGFGGFSAYLGDWQSYVGVDGSASPHADVRADLISYTSQADAIHLRHVLEHNPDWRKILSNVLVSFRKRAVVTIFTPFSEVEQILAKYPNFLGTGATMVDISLIKKDVDQMIADRLGVYKIEKEIKSNTQYGKEYIYFLSL